MLCCLFFLALSIDIALFFLPGGPTLKAVCVDLDWEWLDFEEDEGMLVNNNEKQCS